MTEIILTSSVLILLLVILRQALRGRISPCVQYALWLLAAARLLIPGTLFSAPVSVLGAAEGLQTSLHETFPGPSSLPEPVVNEVTGQLPKQPSQPAVPPDAAYPNEDIIVNYQMLAPETAPPRVYNWPDILWKTGIAFTGGALVISNLTFYFQLRKNRKRLTLPDAPWPGKLPVYEVDGLSSPCLFGLFRPSIYLNEAAMDAAHPEHILAHEYAHYRHGDHIWALLRSVCLAVHWYNPLVWWAAALSRRDCELACDAAALKHLGEGARIDYGQTLLGMVSKGRSPAALLHAATTMTAGKRAMKERIALIIKQPRMRKVTLVLVAALACLLAACAFGGKAETQTPEETPASVYLGEALSSQARPGPITDPETVSRLWELYQGFVFDGTTEELTRDNVWSVTVTFQDEAGSDMARFTIFEGGLCWLEDDYETIHVLRDGQAIYETFRECCRNVPRDMNYVPVKTAEANVLNEVLARLDRLHGEEAAVYHFSSKLGAPANGTLTERETAALEEAFRDCQWTRTEDPGDDLVYWHRTSVAGFTFYDGSPLVSYTHSQDGGVDWYYAPEGWVTVEAALFYDTDTTHTLAEKKGLFLYEQARATWNGFQSGWLPERYDGMFETEEGTWLSVGFFESLADYRGYLETMFSPEIVENLLGMYTFQDYDGRLHILQHGEGASNIYAGDEIVTVFTLSSEEAVQYGYDGHIFAQTPVLGEDLETVLGYKRHDYYYSWNGTHYVFTNFGPSDDVDPQIYDNAEEIIAQIQQGADTSEWLSDMTVMDWQVLAQTAINAGMDGGDGFIFITETIMGAIDQCIDQRGPALDQADYLYMISAVDGLDGAAAERYAGIIYRLYENNPGQFAYVVLELLGKNRQNEALDLFRGEWMFHREIETDTAPSREEAIAQLESDLSVSLSARPSEMTLHSPGEMFLIVLTNLDTFSGTTFTSSDPNVAEVDANGFVTAIGPGEATISLHYTGSGGPWDFTCDVLCDW